MRPVDRFEGFLLDLDGVLYRGDEVVAGAPEAVSALRAAGRAVVFLTNNSARTPEQVAAKLSGMGIDAAGDEVVTSAQATAREIARSARSDGRATTAFVIGERGVREALAGAGIDVVGGEPEEAGFVVVGWDRGVDYAKLRTATVLVHRGASLVATNADASYPAPGGERWPGAGALLAAVEAASGERATVVGKPHRPLFDEAVERLGTDRALMVGDRIETDIAGAAAAGLDTALVLTGAAGPGDVLDHDTLPSMLLDDVAGLLVERPDVRIRGARPGDAAAVQELLRESSLEPGETDPESTVVAAGDRVVGTATAPVRGRAAYLHSVAVAEAARGRHLGIVVTAAVLRAAAGRGARVAYVLTETAVGFFGTLGFEATDRGALPTWVLERSSACSESAVAMRRPLAPPT